MLATGQREKANFTPKQQVLLDYVKVLTLTPSEVRDTDVEKMRKAGWTDDQIFDATFDIAMFAFFNRMADAYGLDYSKNYWMPPTLRAVTDKVTPAPFSGSPKPRPPAPK